MELHLPFIEAREQRRSVIERPDAVVDLLESDEFTGEVLLVKIRPFFQRIMPFCEIFRVSRCPAYAMGGSEVG